LPRQQLLFRQRAETFGLDTADPWALPALRLLFHAPRVYAPLLAAWEQHFPSTRRAVARLVDLGFVAYQPPVKVDVRTGATAPAAGRQLSRFRLSAAGRRLLAEAAEDVRVLEDRFAKLTPANAEGLLRLLEALDVPSDRSRVGISAPHATTLTPLAPRTARWWIRRLHDAGLVRRLDVRAADVREVIPAHWRVTKPLCRQLTEVTNAFPDPWASLQREFRLARVRFLGDIDPARVGIAGNTDFDHDVVAQEIVARLLRSPHTQITGVFELEPRIVLPTDTSVAPWRFAPSADYPSFYQPDAVVIDRAPGVARRNIVEYERKQTRRDAWGHIERFLGYLALQTLPFEPAVLRFVLDTRARERGYVELIEAFADYCLDHPERLPANAVELAVSSVPRLADDGDPLDPQRWFRVTLRPPSGTAPQAPPDCRLHDTGDSPYDDYFTGLAS
jgi:hypothetical protein